MRRFNAFSNSVSELAKGDGDRGFGDIRDKGFHQRWVRGRTRNGGIGIGYNRKDVSDVGELNNQQ